MVDDAIIITYERPLENTLVSASTAGHGFSVQLVQHIEAELLLQTNKSLYRKKAKKENKPPVCSPTALQLSTDGRGSS